MAGLQQEPCSLDSSVVGRLSAATTCSCVLMWPPCLLSLLRRSRVSPLKTVLAGKGRSAARGRYLISVSSLNIGRYIEMITTPTIRPTPSIMIGSTIEVSDWIEASTSSS